MQATEPIDQIKEHLNAGGRVAINTCTRVTLLTKKHLEYIRPDADGKGFRLGWPGKKSLYCFAYQIRLVA
jgi:hypothetical protein